MGKLKEYYHEVICTNQIEIGATKEEFLVWLETHHTNGKTNVLQYDKSEIDYLIAEWKFYLDAKDMEVMEHNNRI